MAGRGKTHKTYEKIIHHLRGSISSGELKPGDRLPPETELARGLGVSRPTVREALKVLEAMNMLRSSTGPTGGTFVRAIDGSSIAENLKDSIVLLMDVDGMTFAELYEAREAIEVPTAGMAAVRRTDADLLAIQKIIEANEEMDSDGFFSDLSFHQAIADASKNGMLNLFMSSVHMTVGTMDGRDVSSEEVPSISQRQHRRIYQAILDRAPDAARSAMREHLQFAYTVYRQAIPEKESEARAAHPTEYSPSG